MALPVSRTIIVGSIIVAVGLFLAFLGAYTIQRKIWSQKISIAPHIKKTMQIGKEPYSYLRGSLNSGQSNGSLLLVDASTGEILLSGNISEMKEFYIARRGLSKIYILLNSNSTAELNLSAYQSSEPYAILGIPAFILTFAGMILFLKRIMGQVPVKEEENV